MNFYRKKFYRRILGYVFIMLVVSAGAIVWYGLHDNLYAADIAVVLGNEVYSDGSCSPRLQARLDRAAEVYQQGLCKKIIVSGGTGKSGYNEAIAMHDYLVNLGVPSADIINDANGNNTRMTAQFAKKYMQDHNLSSIIAVSQYFHISRTKLALEQEGVSNVASAHAKYFALEDIFSIAREVPAYIFYFCKIK